MVSTLFRDPQARSSALAALGTPQPRAFGSLNRVETLDSTSNYYIEHEHHSNNPNDICIIRQEYHGNKAINICIIQQVII